MSLGTPIRPGIAFCTALAYAFPLSTANAGRAVAAIDLVELPRERVSVETRAGQRHEFRAWRADRAETRAQGLMFVSAMADDEAMVFVYEEPQVVNMWMKNTYLPLDMLFVDERGCVVKVAEHATPLSLRTITSGAPVLVVLELKAGRAAQSGIAAGDRLRRPDAGWPPRDGSRC